MYMEEFTNKTNLYKAKGFRTTQSNLTMPTNDALLIFNQTQDRSIINFRSLFAPRSKKQ